MLEVKTPVSRQQGLPSWKWYWALGVKFGGPQGAGGSALLL